MHYVQYEIYTKGKFQGGEHTSKHNVTIFFLHAMSHLPGWPRVCTPCLYSGIPLWFLRASDVGPRHHRGIASEDGLFKTPQKAFHSVKLFRARLQVLTRKAKICNFKRAENVNFSVRGACWEVLHLSALSTRTHVWKSFRSNTKPGFFSLQTTSFPEVRSLHGICDDGLLSMQFPINTWLFCSHLFSRASLFSI